MHRLPRCAQALGCLLMIVPLALCSCSVGRAGREAGGAAFDGAKDAAEKWWTEEGKSKAEEIARVAASKAKEAAIKAAEEKRAELAKKIDDGSATPMDIALYILLGGLGAGGTGKILERLLIGKRGATEAKS